MILHSIRNFYWRVIERAMKEAGFHHTASGWVDEEDIHIERETSEAPCGSIEATDYFLNGKLVRRDINVMTNGMVLGTATGNDKENQQ